MKLLEERILKDGIIKEGGIVKVEGAFYACKASLYCSKCGKGVRAGYKMVGDKKVRVCKKCGQEL